MKRTLVVANRTAGTPELLTEVEHRAATEPTAFTLLVPEVKKGQDWTLEQALAALRKAAAGPSGEQTPHVDGRVTDLDPLAAIRDALLRDRFHEVLISTLPAKRSLWLRKDLPAEVRKLRVPVTVITPPEDPKAKLEDIAFFGGPG